MKVIGYLCIIVGGATLLYLGYRYFFTNDHLLSPLPEEKGVRVIFVTPGK